LDCTEAANADKVAEGRKRGGGEKEREKENWARAKVWRKRV
jgi:hypothetical protein